MSNWPSEKRCAAPRRTVRASPLELLADESQLSLEAGCTPPPWFCTWAAVLWYCIWGVLHEAAGLSPWAKDDVDDVKLATSSIVKAGPLQSISDDLAPASANEKAGPVTTFSLVLLPRAVIGGMEALPRDVSGGMDATSRLGKRRDSRGGEVPGTAPSCQSGTAPERFNEGTAKGD